MGLLSKIGGAISAPFVGSSVASMGGDLLGYRGVKKTNEANMNIASARNAMEVDEAQKARDWSSKEAQINRDFQETMSSTAVSRRMQDMKNAGINPILAGKFDASSPAGGIGGTAKANAHGYEERNKWEGALSSSNAILQLKQQMALIEKTKAETQNIKNTVSIKNPIANIADSVNSVVHPLAVGFQSNVPKVRNSVQNIVKPILEQSSNSAKTVKDKQNRIEDTIQNWWEQLREDKRQFNKNMLRKQLIDSGKAVPIPDHFYKGR